ncbi:MAG: EamA family transporter [Bacteroidetes bacterium]|nr:EamA family transporter [Bacteroidota bacterium]MBS1628860.1 EamA family transporter [Bacteroidota bacterium]
MWLLYAILSAVFAGAVAILAKLGMEGVDSDLATAIRCIVIVVVAWGIVWARGLAPQVPQLGLKNWLFMSLSGIATGLSWLFYFRALKIARVAQVVPIDKLSIAFAIVLAFLVLGEVPSLKVAIGAALVIAGSLVIAL